MQQPAAAQGSGAATMNNQAGVIFKLNFTLRILSNPTKLNIYAFIGHSPSVNEDETRSERGMK